jgi:hypothetical protein
MMARARHSLMPGTIVVLAMPISALAQLAPRTVAGKATTDVVMPQIEEKA